MSTRSIAAIAREIRADWKKVYFGAVPYLSAMQSLDSVSDRYEMDNARVIVRYVLSNAAAWRGDVARRVKTELKAMIA